MQGTVFLEVTKRWWRWCLQSECFQSDASWYECLFLLNVQSRCSHRINTKSFHEEIQAGDASCLNLAEFCRPLQIVTKVCTVSPFCHFAEVHDSWQYWTSGMVSKALPTTRCQTAWIYKKIGENIVLSNWPIHPRQVGAFIVRSIMDRNS